MKKSCEGSEHSTTWADRPIAAVSTCVLRKKSIQGCTQGSRVGRPTAAVGVHMCVSKHTHTCLVQKKSIEALTISKALAYRLLL